MFTQKTVMVIGAGASKEFDFPLGNGLRDKIYDRLQDSDEDFWTALSHLGAQRANDLVALGRDVARGLHAFESVDQFLEYNEGNEDYELLVKLAIAKEILLAEANAPVLSGDSEMKLGDHAISKTWLGVLLRMLNAGGRFKDPHRIFENLTFICFNYDRCIEQFFWKALPSYRPMTTRERRTAMTHLRVLHPYGTVGRLPWQEGERPEVPFGARVGVGGVLRSAAEGIRTYGEQIQSEEMEDAWAALEGAEKIVFIGFGFLAQNMDLLSPRNCVYRAQKFGTCYEVSQSNREVFTRRVTKFAKGRGVVTDADGAIGDKVIKLVPATAAKFLTDVGNELIE